jgi:hypothetical protein
MLNIVNIPESVKDIKNAIARRITILAEWNAMLAKTRCKVRRHSRQLQADCTRAQIAELRKALVIAQEKVKVEKAQAFVSSLASVRKDWENGLFD